MASSKTRQQSLEHAIADRLAAQRGEPRGRRCRLRFFFFSSRSRHTRYIGDWSSDVCSSDLYGPDVLYRFDFVIGSIHSRFGMSEAEMTRRVLTAMDDPHLAILGHPTGRLLLQREPYAIDLEQVLAKAAARGIAVEVNADPHRLDLDWRMVRRARELGVTCSIGADAHSTSGMANVAVGLGIARKGWLEPDQVLNTRDAEAFLAFARARLVAAG